MFAAALILHASAMIANPFFSPALRIQTERRHSVITRGPYRIIRHPGYCAMLVAVPASALAVGSWLALIPAIAFSAVIIRRTALEDPRAITTSVYVVRAFVKLRALVHTQKDFARKLEELEKRLVEHDQNFEVVFTAIRELMQPPEEPPKRRIGFSSSEEPKS